MQQAILDVLNEDGLDAAICELFERRGQYLSTRQIAERCIEDGVFDHLADVALLKFATERVRKALGRKDKNGLPIAGRVRPAPGADKADGEQWVQLRLWSYDDYAYNITERVRGVSADVHTILQLYRSCMQRFGCAPELPAWMMD